MLGEMSAEIFVGVFNHLWQSTVFVVLIGLLTLGFRKNRAHIRYWLWFSASAKFLLPFALLMSLGHRLHWAPATAALSAVPAIAHSALEVSQPLSEIWASAPSAPQGPAWTAIAIVLLWACGCAAIGLVRFRDWRRIQASVRASGALDISAHIPVRCSPGLLEPGVVGVFRPILLFPTGITERLQPAEMQAILAHELCHVQRRDNLASAVHMIVEALFWFHPLVWWIGARLMEEREQACDEAVLRLGNEARDYAAGILTVCKNYLESPLSCVSGVTGSNPKKRIQAILTGRIALDLTVSKKLMLTASVIAALGLPLLIGLLSAATPKFTTVSIKPCTVFARSDYLNLPLGTFHPGCTTVQRLIQQADGLFANGHMNPASSVAVTGGPAWTTSALYQIEAQANEPLDRSTMNGPMLEALLEDRFKLKFHRETRPTPVYALTAPKILPKLEPFAGTCVPSDWDHPHPDPKVMCTTSHFTANSIDMDRASIADLCIFLLVTLDRPPKDETGITGRYNFHLEMPTAAFSSRARGIPPLSNPNAPASEPAVIAEVKSAIHKLGLTLEPTTRPGEVIVIDHIEKPATL